MQEGNVKEKLLSSRQGKALVLLARKTITEKFPGKTVKDAVTEDMFDDPAFQEKRGTFVTLKVRGNLRGCIGSLAAVEPLVNGVRRNAINAAFHDPRFPPLGQDELERISIEVSILTEPHKLEYTDGDDLVKKLRPGVDGLVISKGRLSATFLPQVWAQLPGPQEFLSHLCLKAGLSSSAWKTDNLEVSTYQVQYFEEGEEV